MANPKSISAACPRASASFLRLNPQLATKAPAVDMSHDPYDVTPTKKSLRQKSGPKLNKTEAAFAEWLRANAADSAFIGAQNVTLEIANGCRYTPDFNRLCPGYSPTFWEVKGFMRDDAAVKIKVAARMFPACCFFLVFRDKSQPSGWRIEEVMP